MAAFAILPGPVSYLLYKAGIIGYYIRQRDGGPYIRQVPGGIEFSSLGTLFHRATRKTSEIMTELEDYVWERDDDRGSLNNYYDKLAPSSNFLSMPKESAVEDLRTLDRLLHDHPECLKHFQGMIIKFFQMVDTHTEKVKKANAEAEQLSEKPGHHPPVEYDAIDPIPQGFPYPFNYKGYLTQQNRLPFHYLIIGCYHDYILIDLTKEREEPSRIFNQALRERILKSVPDAIILYEYYCKGLLSNDGPPDICIRCGSWFKIAYEDVILDLKKSNLNPHPKWATPREIAKYLNKIDQLSNIRRDLLRFCGEKKKRNTYRIKVQNPGRGDEQFRWNTDSKPVKDVIKKYSTK